MAIKPTILVLFGVTGDLAKRKILPALFALHKEKLLPPMFQVVGISRRNRTEAEMEREIRAALPRGSENIKKQFVKKFKYLSGDARKKETFLRIGEAIGRKDGKWISCANRLFYLSVPPSAFSVLFRNIEATGLSSRCSIDGDYSRILVEKPFGKDLATAQKLDAMMARFFREEQIFRVDHYLSKDTLQNVLTFRFSNTIFEPLWNNKYIDRIQITLKENLDIEGRGEFYDDIGAIRDVGQNHMLQMLALITMERPRELKDEHIRRNRAKILQNIAQPNQRSMKEFVRGQYQGYKSTPGVKRGSKTETYFRNCIYINSPKWKGVPIVLESGKALDEKRTEIVVTFKNPPSCFCDNPKEFNHPFHNKLVFNVQPEEGITVNFAAKKPGLFSTIEPRMLSFMYHEDSTHTLDEYSKVIYDAILGDQTLFASSEEVLASWKYITPLIKRARRIKLYPYKRGSSTITNK
ncbi:glucose-6-phosphate dehydrogenase [Patescibacteria group bacterium]